MATYLDDILLGKQYVGIEFFSLHKEDMIAFLQTERKKNEIIINENIILTSKESLITKKIQSPVILIINNNHVLQKEVQGIDPNDRKLLHKGFPNLQIDEFYYEIWRKDSFSIISICRKNYIDDLINYYSFKIASVSLGVNSIGNLKIFSVPPIISTNTQTIFLENSENFIQAGSLTKTDYEINGLNISNQYLLCFSGILKLILPEYTTGNIQNLNIQLLDNFKQKSFFEKTIKIGIALILGILLINFFVFTYYFDKANQTNETVLLNKSDIQDIAKVKARIKDKELTLKSFLNTETLRSSLLINDIVKAIPPTILLSDINYYPLEKKVKQEEHIFTLDKVIYISGTTIINSDFTTWIEQVNMHKNIKNVIINSFEKDFEGTTLFSIKILME